MTSSPKISTLLALLLASSLTVMAAATIAPTLPQIEQAFADTPNVALLTRLVLTVTAIFVVIGSPIAGVIVDRYGRKTLLLFGLALYAVSGTSGLYVDSLMALLVGRCVLGLSVACIMTSATTLFADLYTGPQKARALGRQSAFMGAGGVAFLLLGGTLAEFGWRVPFGIYFTSLAVLVLVWLFVFEPERPPPPAKDAPKIAWPIGLVMLIMGLVISTQAAFYFWPVQLPFFLAERFALGGSAAGLAIACSSGTGAIVSMFYRQVRARLSDLAIIAFVFAALGVANIVVSQAGSFPVVLVAMIIGGLGIGLAFPTAANWMTNAVPQAARGRAVGLASSSIFLGHFTSPFISQPLMQAFGFARGYELFGYGLLGLALIVVGGALISARRAAQA